MAWDGDAGAMLVSVDGGDFVAPFPPDAVRPSAAAGAGLYPAICGEDGCVVEWSTTGGMGLAPPSPDYVPCCPVSDPDHTTPTYPAPLPFP